MNSGATTVPILSAEERHVFLDQISKQLEQQPEFIPGYKGPYGLGAFGGLNTAGAMHCPKIRELRMLIFERTKSFFQEFLEDGFQYRPLMDRYCIRRTGTKVTSEKFHQDQAKDVKFPDFVLGGWINLSSNNQFFSFVPNSHDKFAPHHGFVSHFSTEENKNFKKTKTVLSIPPGNLVVFFAHVVHEVKAITIKGADQHRLFVGWLCSKSKIVPDHLNILTVLEDQAVPRCPSSEAMPLFAKNHLVFHRSKVVEFSANFVPELLEKRTAKRKAGTLGPEFEYTTVKRFCPSLREQKKLGLPYSDEEHQMFNTWH